MINNGFIKINGLVLPQPNRGLNIKREQFVKSARNARGEVVAQKVNRRIIKIDALEWEFLPANTWRTIQQQIELFEGTLEYWDNLSGSFKTIKIYWGDESSEPYRVNKSTGEVLEYAKCKCNIVDMGY